METKIHQQTQQKEENAHKHTGHNAHSIWGREKFSKDNIENIQRIGYRTKIDISEFGTRNWEFSSAFSQCLTQF